MARAKDFDRELEALVAVIEQEGAAQAEDIGLQTGKTPKDGFWRVEPPVSGRGPGSTLTITTPENNSFRCTIPKRGCSADTIRIFTRQAERYGFDFDQARTAQKTRAQEKTKRLAEETAARELAMHQQQKQQQNGAKANAPARKKRKKWPREEIVHGDINATYAQDLLDDPGDGTLRPRPIYPSNVNRFKGMIKRKTWLPTDTHVDWYGFVLNGRHRFQAVIELAAEFDDPNFSVPFKIIYGVDPALYPTFDTPRLRSSGDTLVIGGYNSPEGGGQAHNHMAAALKMVHCWRNNLPWGSWSKTRFENDEIIVLAELYPLIHQAMEMAAPLYRGRRPIGQVRYRPTPSIVFCYLALERYPDCWALMEHFIRGITVGEPPTADPRRALYNLMRERTGEESGGETIPGSIRQLALLLKAYRQFCTGYQYKRGGAIGWRKGERMPQPVTGDEVTIDLPQSEIPVVL